MREIRACQLIYGNFAEEESPSGRAGFQTAFYTRSGLMEAEVEEIEARLLYFPSAAQPVKRLFFLTANRRPVVAQIVPLSRADTQGRQGSYLAHALVLENDVVTSGQIRAYELLDQIDFILSIQQALARGDRHTGDIPAMSLCIPEAQSFGQATLNQWPPESLRRLTLCALRARDFETKHLTVAFVGQPEEVLRALSSALCSVPMSLLPYCTFDTYFYRCNPVVAHFWSVGLPDPPLGPRFFVADLKSRTVRADGLEPPQTSYERWVVAAIEVSETDFARKREAAFMLCEWLDGKAKAPGPARREHDLVESVFHVNADQVKARVNQRLSEICGPVLASAVEGDICRVLDSTRLLEAIDSGFKLSNVTESLYSRYKSRSFAPPDRGEIRALESLLARTESPALQVLCDCWLERRERLMGNLQRLSSALYRHLIEASLRGRFVDPLWLLFPGSGPEFLDACLPQYGIEESGALARMAGALVESGNAEWLSRLMGHVAGRCPGELKSLAKLLRTAPDAPADFVQAVKAAQAAAAPSAVGSMLARLFGARSGRKS
ncbi:MAG: hypothetical protein M1570_02915 [Chloroflexi bacterium]|nr:hypothetical protein [Chloroflexota bacterium]